MRRAILAVLAAVFALAAGCSDAAAPAGPTPPPGDGGSPAPSASAAPVYAARPPAGKLPWPQHNPAWSRARYEAMLDSVWVVNNFALYQGGGTRATLYLHDGLDVVLPNGTPIYAVESGTVRANIGGNEFYRTLIVEDDDEPGLAWSYTHVNGFKVQPGQHVAQGTELASVRFQGLEHTHLSRVRLRPGGSWESFGDTESLQPDTFFVYADTEPPVFEGRFRYLRDGTDAPFLPDAAGRVTVSGDVDVSVGLRDPGEWARSKTPVGGLPYGDRNAPNRVEYEIAPEGGGAPVARGTAFDFSRTGLPRGSGSLAAQQVLALYQFYEAVQPAPPPVGNYNRKFNFVIVTNTDGPTPGGPLDPARHAGAWRTAERDAAGQPRFPNGDYVVTVRAADFKGNVATRSETVRVAN